jgi:hypothetical protein
MIARHIFVVRPGIHPKIIPSTTPPHMAKKHPTLPISAQPSQRYSNITVAPSYAIVDETLLKTTTDCH